MERRHTIIVGAPSPSIVGAPSSSPADPATQVFDGFPYLVVRLAPAIYWLTPVPAAAAREELIALARGQAVSNQLPACLAFGLRDGVYCDPEGKVVPRELIPRGGTQVTGPLRLGRDLACDEELAARGKRLEAYLRERQPRAAIAMGDLEKGGRAATLSAERAAVPRGLSRCAVCGEWRGECLDPAPRTRDLLVRVSCRCENRNRCARCAALLHERALNAYYYEEGTGRVVHVAGVAALGHRCGDHSP